jgi:hypothetical protein
MRESLNLATAGVGIGDGRGATGFGGGSIGDRAVFFGGRVGANEGDGVGGFARDESVRIEYCIADAVGGGVGVAILQDDGFPAHGHDGKMGRSQEIERARSARHGVAWRRA